MAHTTLPKNPPPENRARLSATRHSGNAGVAPLVADPSVPAAVNAEMGDNRAILALDLGTVTGWALRHPDGSIHSGTVSFRNSRYDGGGMRYLRFRNWFDDLANRGNLFGAVYFEEVRRHAGIDSSHVYGGFVATLAAWCEHHGIPYQGVPVGTIKRHVTGKGNADKAAVIAAVRERGHQPADDNEADAIAILIWAIETRGGVR